MQNEFVIDYEKPIDAALKAVVTACEAGNSKDALNYAAVAQMFVSLCQAPCGGAPTYPFEFSTSN